MLLAQELDGLRRAGLTHWYHRLQPPTAAMDDGQAESTPEVLLESECVPRPDHRQPAGVKTGNDPALDAVAPGSAGAAATAETGLQSLAECVAGCQRCPELARTRTRTVFGVGNPAAQILFLGEAPGADEDRIGEPFVGRAGKLLNDIIAACQLKREELYICNVLHCRPPGNRNPSTQEAANCREFLDGQIGIVNPRYIVCWGTVAAQSLLDTKTTIGRLRQQFFQYGQAKVVCTYHPSYLLRNPSAKVHVWADMKFLMRDLGVHLDASPQ